VGVSDPSTDSSESADDATEWMTDVLYTGVGLGVLAVNRLQVARRQALKRIRANPTAPGPGMEAIAQLLSDPEQGRALLLRVRDELQEIDDRVGGIENRFLAMLDNLEPDLPEGARQVAGALRTMAADHATQARAVLGLRIPE